MSAVPMPKKRPPRFITYQEVEVDIDQAELERAGWRYYPHLDEDNAPPNAPTFENAIDVVRRWHDDTHEGPWQWCAEQPCDTLRGRGEPS